MKKRFTVSTDGSAPSPVDSPLVVDGISGTRVVDVVVAFNS
jgi:hypothetical protein